MRRSGLRAFRWSREADLAPSSSQVDGIVSTRGATSSDPIAPLMSPGASSEAVGGDAGGKGRGGGAGGAGRGGGEGDGRSTAQEASHWTGLDLPSLMLLPGPTPTAPPHSSVAGPAAARAAGTQT